MGFYKKASGSFTKNHGVPGVVYILENPGLRHGYVKIGCTSRSGAARAYDLNKDANTGTPGSYHCIFEFRTKDCGLAEQRVFVQLRDYRKGKWGQEFFEVDIEHAKALIRRVCGLVDSEVLEREQSAAIRTDSPSAPIERFKADPPPPYHPTADVRKNRSLKKWAIVAGILGAFIWWAHNVDNPRPRPAPVSQKSKASAPGAGSSVAVPKPQRKSRSEAPRTDTAGEPLKNSTAMQATPEQSLATSKSEEQLQATMPEPARSNLADVAEEDRSLIESVCRATHNPDSSTYQTCVNKQVQDLVHAAPGPDLSKIPSDDVVMIHSACQPARHSGPAAYRLCVSNQVEALTNAPPYPSFAKVSPAVADTIRRECLPTRQTGPAEYRKCLVNQVDAIKRWTISQPSRR